jgi:acyl-CoA synthetase (NDP forming)
VTRQLADYSEKPVLLINSSSFTNVTRMAAEWTAQGVPVINGIDVALRSLRNLMQYPIKPSLVAAPKDANFMAAALSRWTARLAQDESCDELTALQLMADFDLPTVDFALAEDMAAVASAATKFGFPLVLKTAMPGIAHKSDQNGVKVGIVDAEQLQREYSNLQQRLGDRVVVMPMVAAGVEVALGMKNDAQFGPMIIVACGGVLIELLAERAFALAPLDVDKASALIERTRLAKLLAGVRGKAAVDRVALKQLIVRFSQLAFALRDSIAEIDLNPVIVGATGCTIVDALVIPAGSGRSGTNENGESHAI